MLAPTDAKWLADALRDGGMFCAGLPPWPAAAALCLDAYRRAKTGVIAITDGPLSMERLAADIAALAATDDGTPPVILPFPARESFSGHAGAPQPRIDGERLATLRACRERDGRFLIVTTIQALMQRTVSPEQAGTMTLGFTAGSSHDTSTVLARLEHSGYTFEPEVLVPGQASWRGGILDVWPPGDEQPLRVEFFGPEVESIRRFDPVEQRSTATLSEAVILPATEPSGPGSGSATLPDHLPAGLASIWIDEENIADHADLFMRTADEAAEAGNMAPPDAIRARLAGHGTGIHLFLAPPTEAAPRSLDAEPLAGVPAAAGSALPMDRIEEQRTRFLRQLFERRAAGWTLRFFFGTPGTMDRFKETALAEERDLTGIFLHEGLLSESMAIPGRQTLLISDADLYGIRREQGSAARKRGARKQKVAGERIHSWSDIQPGDYVVHVDHGIGIYRGMTHIDVNGRRQEALAVEYAGKAKIYIPTAQTHLLSRYIGVGKRHPELHTIGGKRWVREKAAAVRSVEDLAAQLLETQAARDAKAGHAFGSDTPWQAEFEAAFPYEETPDQAQAIAEVKADMESTRPMDRLVCGDVGYGKTEVAMRAAFKAVMDGRQVAMLVPTTVLAQQHYDTFTERMGAFPVRIEMLSRFQTAGEQDAILERLAAGSVDIVIGTHRLVQKDVRFRNLGLVIIDEEQRFGVKQKEFLKQVRQLVDVLTMTATPIPRTLYMSLTGAKDLSIIETAPVERLPIETIITEHRDDVIREAILRELNREGQVYFLHNRVQTIEHVRNRLVHLVPEARIRIAHGQMNEHELSAIMRAFTHGEFDVLLCTTIIESGLNIPNVNTILIDRADRFGLAELYQLRGRVGRYKRKAFAYLLLPKHGNLFFMARQRIGAVKRYSSLGSGFKLAMRDLELRGAGNILGSEQSGHIATVGFDLYCQLLQRTVARLKGEAVAPVIEVDLDLDFVNLSPDAAHAADAAALPITYIEDETLRVRMYRRVAGITGATELESLREELRDRFGAPPEPAARLLTLVAVRLAAAEQGIRRIEVNGEKVIMTRRGDFIMTGGKFPRLLPGGATARLERLLEIVAKAPPEPPPPRRPDRASRK